MTIDFLSDIGNPVKLDKRTDPNGQANDRFKRGMSVVDLIPVNYDLNLAKFIDSEKTKEFIVKYDFLTAIGDFQAACDSYKIEKANEIGGLRLWLTGDTISQEEISNNFGDNIIQTALNNLSNMGKGFQEGLKALGGTGSALGQAATDKAAAGVAAIAGMAGEGVGVSAGGIAKVAGKLLMEGKHFSLPKVWKDSTYNPSLSLNVKLISPYGDQESVKKHVLIPLVQLLILASPSSDDGLTYGHPKYLKVKAYGITNINIGFISSISINRGGADTTYNIWRQPTSLDLTISISPALNGFASVWDHDSKIEDVADVDSINNPSNYDLEKTGPGLTTIGNVINSFRAVPTDIQAPLGMSAADGQQLANDQSQAARELIIPQSTIDNPNNKVSAARAKAKGKAKDVEDAIVGAVSSVAQKAEDIVTKKNEEANPPPAIAEPTTGGN
jgi:hypothetical protein